MRTATIRLPGHPDHACDLVAEAIVDEYLRRDQESRLRIVVSGGRGVLFIAGDVLSRADFDVSALVKRTLGTLGITDEIEAFVSLEPVSSERVAVMKLLPESPITVTGYATNETSEKVPESVSLAKRLGKILKEKREKDPEWFWLGPDAEITVLNEKISPRAVITLEHGSESLDAVRSHVQEVMKESVPEVRVEVNLTGGRDRRGLSHMTGISGRSSSPYGSFVPGFPNGIGHDVQSPEKAGAWFVRKAAKQIVENGARAAMVHATYFPGERTPHSIVARDERGNDRSSLFTREDFHLDRAMKQWWRPNLNVDAAMWGFAGEPGLPWEE